MYSLDENNIGAAGAQALAEGLLHCTNLSNNCVLNIFLSYGANIFNFFPSHIMQYYCIAGICSWELNYAVWWFTFTATRLIPPKFHVGMYVW